MTVSVGQVSNRWSAQIGDTTVRVGVFDADAGTSGDELRRVVLAGELAGVEPGQVVVNPMSVG